MTITATLLFGISLGYILGALTGDLNMRWPKRMQGWLDGE